MRAEFAKVAFSVALVLCGCERIQTAQIKFYSRCEDTDLVARPEANIVIPWAKGVAIELTYNKRIWEQDPAMRSWDWYGNFVLADGDSYPANLIGLGLITFDGRNVRGNQRLPSLVKEKNAIANIPEIRIGKLRFPNCKYYLLKTDFGPRRTIECEKIGMVAEDGISSYTHVPYPMLRIVSTQVIDWSFRKFEQISSSPPYNENVISIIKTLEPKSGFVESCRRTFEEILGGAHD